MRKTVSAFIAVCVLLMLASGVSLADCDSDCDNPFLECVKMCNQTIKEDSKESAACMDKCYRQVTDCLEKCRVKKGDTR